MSAEYLWVLHTLHIVTGILDWTLLLSCFALVMMGAYLGVEVHVLSERVEHLKEINGKLRAMAMGPYRRHTRDETVQ